MPTPSDGNWFLIMTSWEIGADEVAIERFHKVYEYLMPLMKDDWRKEMMEIDQQDARLAFTSGTVKALNLIGRRTFIIIGQTRSNRVLQLLSRMISLKAPISVEIFPATDVHDLKDLL